MLAVAAEAIQSRHNCKLKLVLLLLSGLTDTAIAWYQQVLVTL